MVQIRNSTNNFLFDIELLSSSSSSSSSSTSSSSSSSSSISSISSSSSSSSESLVPDTFGFIPLSTTQNTYIKEDPDNIVESDRNWFSLDGIADLSVNKLIGLEKDFTDFETDLTINFAVTFLYPNNARMQLLFSKDLNLGLGDSNRPLLFELRPKDSSNYMRLYTTDTIFAKQEIDEYPTTYPAVFYYQIEIVFNTDLGLTGSYMKAKRFSDKERTIQLGNTIEIFPLLYESYRYFAVLAKCPNVGVPNYFFIRQLHFEEFSSSSSSSSESSSSSSSSESSSSESSSSSSKSSSSSSISSTSSSSSSESESIISDDFTGSDGDSPNPALWTTANATIEIQNNRLNYDPIPPHEVAVDLISVFTIEDDFDLTYDFIINTLTNPGSTFTTNYAANVRIRRVSDDSAICYGGRIYDGGFLGGINGYRSGGAGGASVEKISLSDSSGKIRVTRINSEIRFYYWNNSLSRWEWNGNTSGRYINTDNSDVYISIFSYELDSPGQTVNVDIDNFQIIG